MTRPHPWRAASTAPSACPPRRPCSPWRASRRMSPTGTPTRSSGPTARPGSPPGSSGHDRRPRLRQLDGGAVRRPAPGAGPLPGPLAARAGNHRYPHGEHGPGLVPRSRRGGDRGLAGGQSRGLVRTSGLAHPHLRGGRPQTVGRALVQWCGLLAPASPVSALAADSERHGGSERDTPDLAWRPAGQAAGRSPVPASGQCDEEAPGASAVNDAAVAAYRLSVQAGNPLSERRLAQMFGRTSRRWARARIADARQASPPPRLAEHPGHGLPRKQGRSGVFPECDCDRVG